MKKAALKNAATAVFVYVPEKGAVLPKLLPNRKPLILAAKDDQFGSHVLHDFVFLIKRFGADRDHTAIRMRF